MNAFQKANFDTRGEYVNYEGKFVARFKYQKGSKASFVAFLIKNFTVEEYFGQMAAGKAPLQILQAKGYVQPHVKALLKKAGLPETATGFKLYIERQVAQVRAHAV